MVIFNPKFYITLGSTDNSSIYIKDLDGDWQEFINYEFFRVKKRQNQVSEFEIKIMDLEDAEKLYVKEFAEVLFLSENSLILKGRIQKITYETAYESIATGFGMEAKLLEKELIKSGDKRVQYTNESSQTVANEILSSNTDGVSPWIITPNTTGLFDTDYGDVSIRYEYGNRLSSLTKLAEAIDYEWGVTQGDDYNDDFFNVASLLPNSTRATVSQETFDITGANANCYQTKKETDITNLANKIDCLGYGDGINQKHTSTYNASETYSTLSSDITNSSSTISLIDASNFASSGEIRIMEERITYSGKSGNDLTGCTRGTSSTVALAHKKNIYTEKYVAITSAESGSSIGTNGLMDYTITERDIIDVETLELIASRKLLERMNPIVRIIVSPNEPLETAGNREIGDLITINDSESDLSDDYRIVGMTYISEYGDLSLEIEASNKSLTFIEQMQKQREEAENLSKYMQGATNLYAISETDDGDASNPINIKFFVPNEAVAINKVLLNFKMKPIKTFQAVGDSDTDNNISGTLSSNVYEDTGGSINVDVKTGEKVLVMYSMGLDPTGDPPLGEVDLRIQRDIDGGGYSTLTGSTSYWVPGEGASQTRYWSAAASDFIAASVDTNDVTYSAGYVSCIDNSITFYAPVFLPNGAIVTSCEVTGNISNETWYLKAIPLDGSGASSGTTMATASFNTADTTIGSATIENSSYAYTLQTGSLDNTDRIYGATITYTQPAMHSGDIAMYNDTLAKTILDSPSAGNVTYKLQMGGDTGGGYGGLGSGTLSAMVFSNSFQEGTLSSPSVTVKIGEDGGSSTEISGSPFTSDQTEVDITSGVQDVGVGKWVNIEYTPNQNMKIEANAYVQIFLESK